MEPPARRFALFSGSIDRAAFAAYTLGAVVPLLALAYIADRYVLPVLPGGPVAYGLMAVILCVGVLSLAAFLVLRAVAKDSLDRLDAHNRRLETLLDASRSIAGAPYGTEVCRVVAEAVLTLAKASAAFVLVPSEKEGGSLALEASAGDEASQLFARHAEAVEEVLEQMRAESRLVLGACQATPSGAEAVVLAAAPLATNGSVEGAIVALAPARWGRFDAAQQSALSTLATLTAVARHNADLRDSERNFFIHATEILVNTLDVFVDLQRGHARRVACHSGVVGRELGLDESQLEKLHFAGLLHDIGMLRIDPRTANRATYRQHATLGHRLLKPIRLWTDIAPVVLHHHEWFNGRGYPEGLSGEDIPLGSRIIAVVEAFDSMVSTKSYRRAVSVEEALQEIRQGAGTQFDPTVARVFVELIQRGDLEVDLSS